MLNNSEVIPQKVTILDSNNIQKTIYTKLSYNDIIRYFDAIKITYHN